MSQQNFRQLNNSQSQARSDRGGARGRGRFHRNIARNYDSGRQQPNTSRSNAPTSSYNNNNSHSSRRGIGDAQNLSSSTITSQQNVRGLNNSQSQTETRNARGRGRDRGRGRGGFQQNIARNYNSGRQQPTNTSRSNDPAFNYASINDNTSRRIGNTQNQSSSSTSNAHTNINHNANGERSNNKNKKKARKSKKQRDRQRKREIESIENELRAISF